MATAVANAAARRRLRSRSSSEKSISEIMRQEGWRAQVGLAGRVGRAGSQSGPGLLYPPRPPRPPSATRLLLRALRAQELRDLTRRVLDLHVELALAELDTGAPRVAGDSVVDARRRVRIGLATSAAPLPGLRRRIADGRLDEILAHPALVATEVQHRGRIQK